MIRVAKSVAGLVVLLVGVSGAGAIGCSSTEGSPGGAESESVGSIGLALQVAPGLNLNQVGYVILGPSGFTKSGTLELSNSTTLSAVISGLPAGMGFSITFSGTTSDGATTCAGSASFDVVARQTTIVSVHLTCHQSSGNGSVQVNGTLNVCPVADGIGTNPAEAVTLGTIALSVSASDADHGPSPLSYSWTASSGSFDDATLAAPTFTCTVPGPATISVSVSDGDLAPDCAASASITVTCTPSAADVQTILNTNCVSCHSGPTPPRGLSWVDVRAIVGTSAVECPQKLRIAPGDAAHSYLIDKIQGAAQDGGCFSGRQMPLNKPPLATSDIALIASWINAGTP